VSGLEAIVGEPRVKIERLESDGIVRMRMSGELTSPVGTVDSEFN
jgi:hypothetical protein